MLLYGISFSIAAFLLAVDQLVKYWTDGHMVVGEVRPLLGSVLELHCVHNDGVAWSMLSGMRWPLIAISGLIVLAVLLVLLLRLVRHPLGVFAAFLILSGGTGNLLDRIFLGYVVDMFRFPFWRSYPTFNVADMCVVGGCVLWLIYALFIHEKFPDRRVRCNASAKEADTGAADVPVSGENKQGSSNNAFGGVADTPANNPTNSTPRSPLPRENIQGTDGGWQEQWRRRQRERQGR